MMTSLFLCSWVRPFRQITHRFMTRDILSRPGYALLESPCWSISPMSHLSLLLSVCLTGFATHPHVPRVVRAGLAQGDLTVSYFTVPFNPVHLTDLAPGFSWHAGFARLSTTR